MALTDPTEGIRRIMTTTINANATNREALTVKYGDVWDTTELQRDFTVMGFLAPYVIVKRRSDGAKGSLTFQHSPRFYYNWQQEAS